MTHDTTNDRDRTIAVLGAGGTMGLAMARNLARAGFTVRAWNRTAGKAAPVQEDGGVLCGSPAEAAAGAGILLTMLSDADAVLAAAGEDVVAGAALWLQMSTIGLDGTARCAERAQRLGVPFVDAPVLGTKQPAQEGKLLVLASGPDEARERADAVFGVVGRRTMWVGEAGTATRLKLVCNAWLLALVEGAAESLALAEGLGLDPALLLEAVGGGPLDVPYLQLKGRAMIERSFAPSFSLALAAKDAGLVEDAAHRHGLDLPTLAAIRRRLDAGAREHGEEDMAATFRLSAPG
jgi:3-hydroxyisobutyrate dehydrogenase